MSLTTTANVMQAQSITTSDPTVIARYNLLRITVEQAVKSFLKWGVEAVTDQIDYFDGNGYSDLQIRQPFVSSIANVWLDMTGAYGDGPSAFTGDPLTNGQDYVLRREGGLGRSGILRRLSTTAYWWPSDMIYFRDAGGLSYQRAPYWPAGYGNIKVQYSYGFPPYVGISTITWASGVATITTSAAHKCVMGQQVKVESVSPVDYNGAYVIQSVPTTTSLTINIPTSPGTYVSGGSINAIPDDIQLAVYTMVAIVQNSVKYGWPTQSESLGDYNYSLAISREADFMDARRLLSIYRDTII